MRLPTPPAATIIDTAAPFGKYFSKRRYPYFLAFMTTICESDRPRTITEVQRMASFDRHYSRFWSFLFDGDWPEDQIRRTQVDAVCELDATTTLPDGRCVIVEALDDTLNPKPFGPEIFGVTTHHNHAAKSHQSSYVLSHNHVLHGIIPDAPSPDGARCSVTDGELYLPWDETVESGKETLEYESRLQLAALMTHRHAEAFGPDTVRYQLVDALSNLPPEKESGTPGRPKIYGVRWDWRADFEANASVHEPILYAKKCRLKVLAKVVKIRKYADPVLVIISQFAERKTSKPTLFLCTDTTLDPVVALRLYAARFSLEEAIKDLRHAIGFGSEMVRGRCQWTRLVRMFSLAQCGLRALADHQPDSVRDAVRDPWRTRHHRMTIGEIRQALHYESLTGRRVLARLRPARKRTKTPEPQQSDSQGPAIPPSEAPIGVLKCRQNGEM